MYEELVDLVETFIELCDELLEGGRINAELYDELTKNKLEFLNNEKRVS